MLQHSCTEIKLFFIFPASVQVVREVGTSPSGVQRAGKLGLGGKVPDECGPRAKGGGGGLQGDGMGWDGIEAESEPDVFSLDRIGGGCKKSRVQGVDLDGKRRIKDSVLTEVDSGANLKFSRW